MTTPPEMLQDPQEFEAFLEIVRELDVRSYLEVGAKYGGTFYRVGMALPEGSKCVAVDLPRGTRAWTASEKSLCAVAMELSTANRPTTLLWGDSTDPKIIRQVRELGPFDLILIDANHTMPFVRRDFANYGPMATKAVAFHDISWKRAPAWVGVRIDVPQFWDEIKSSYHHRELRYDTSGKNNGIGVIFTQ